jgi:hypothetical protein
LTIRRPTQAEVYGVATEKLDYLRPGVNDLEIIIIDPDDQPQG